MMVVLILNARIIERVIFQPLHLKHGACLPTNKEIFAAIK
jgi:hypothetical protein